MSSRNKPESSCQKQLRRALIAGDAKESLALLQVAKPTSNTGAKSAVDKKTKFADKKSRTWLGFFSSSLSTPPASLDHHYEDDLGAAAVAYLATGSLLCSAQSSQHTSSREQQSSFSSLLSSWVLTATDARAGPRTDEARAGVLRELLAAGLRPDLAVVTQRADSLLHCCLMNGGSLHVLTLLLGDLPPDYTESLRPNLQGEDANGRTPLDLAVHLGNWEAVGSLLRGGALKDSHQLALVVPRVHAAVAAPSLAPLPVGTSDIREHPSLKPLREVMAFLPFGLGLGLQSRVARRLADSGRAQSAEQLESQLQSMLKEEQQQAGPSGHSNGGSSHVKVMDTADIARAMQEAVAHVQYVLQVDDATAASLLVACNYDTDAAIQSGLQGGSAGLSAGKSHGALGRQAQRKLQASGDSAVHHAVQQEGHGSSSPAGQQQLMAASVGSQPGKQYAPGPMAVPSDNVRQQLQRCLVCWTEKDASKMSIRMPCGHPTCDDCWRGILRARLDDGDPHRTRCPQPECSLLLPMDQARGLLNQEERNRMVQLVTTQYVDVHPRTAWCPRPGCGTSVLVELPKGGSDPDRVVPALASGRGLGVACHCGTRFCFECGKPPHEPATCEQVASWEVLRAKHDLENSSEAWVRSNTKPCPKCKTAYSTKKNLV